MFQFIQILSVRIFVLTRRSRSASPCPLASDETLQNKCDNWDTVIFGCDQVSPLPCLRQQISNTAMGLVMTDVHTCKRAAILSWNKASTSAANFIMRLAVRYSSIVAEHNFSLSIQGQPSGRYSSIVHSTTQLIRTPCGILIKMRYVTLQNANPMAPQPHIIEIHVEITNSA